MELTPGWCKWAVSLDYLADALSQIKDRGVKEYFVVSNTDFNAAHYPYVLFYYNESSPED